MGPSLVANGSGEQPRSSIEVGMPELCLLECTKNGSFRIFFSAAYHQSEPFKTKDDYITCALLLSHRYSWQFYDVFKYIYNYINIYRYIYLYRYTCIYIYFLLRLALIILDNDIDQILTCHKEWSLPQIHGISSGFSDHWSIPICLWFWDS
jgi:hypothetical protein